MNEKEQELLRKICTYHSDDGTSGYLLSEKQFQKIEKDIIDKAVKQREEEIIEMIEQDMIEQPNGIFHHKLSRIILGEEVNIFNQALKDIIKKLKENK